ncbi:Uma2 family endonuclease [Anoxybacillus sp. J5B_2022]|uniref:Uma2 family endonuclease n=1 Tax=Anoxybacillus sp. J5B_2022 TaxID=3003246 RepID=UPI003FA452AC
MRIAEKLRNKRCYGAPDLVVEVLSPSTVRNDRLLKRYYYEKAGVKEYWIADYQHQTIEKYVLCSDSLRLEEVYDDRNHPFVSTVFPNITFSTHDIFSFLAFL